MSFRPFSHIRKAWTQVFERIDPLLLEASWRGEVMHARGRVLLIVVLLILAAARYSGLVDTGATPALLLAAAGLALIISIVLLHSVNRRRPRPWLAVSSSVLDVTMLSAALLGIAITGYPNMALNSRVLFAVYYLIILSTTLRFVPAICLIVGFTTVLEYGLIVWIASTHPMRDVPALLEQYGRIVPAEQIYRLVLLAIGSGIATVTVVQARRLLDSSSRDGLTGLLNRRFLDARLVRDVRRARADRKPLSIALLDLDDFKAFNDRWGHPAGDEALRSLARTLLSAFRVSDVVTRYGGEEFAVLLPDAELSVALPRLQRAIEQIATLDVPSAGPIDDHSSAGHLSASVGLVEFHPEREKAGHVDSAEIVARQLVSAADSLLLEAKRTGKNRVVSRAGHSMESAV